MKGFPPVEVEDDSGVHLEFRDQVKVDFLNGRFATVGEEKKVDEGSFEWKHEEKVVRQLRDGAWAFESWAGQGRAECEDIRISEVRSALLSLRSHSACGADGIHSLMLKKGGDGVALSLLFLFSLSWSQGYLPDSWRQVEIVPVPKTPQAIKLVPFSSHFPAWYGQQGDGEGG